MHAQVVSMYNQLNEKKFKVIIADESHLLKTYSTQRTKRTVPLLKVYVHNNVISNYFIASKESHITFWHSSTIETKVSHTNI